MKKLLLAGLLAISTGPLCAQTEVKAWSKLIGAPNFEYGQGVAVEFFPEPKRVGQQLKLAAQRGFPLALIMGEDEFAKGTAQLKKLAAEESATINWHGDVAVLADAVLSVLRGLGRG